MDDETRQKIVTAARARLGEPCRKRGITSVREADCAQFVLNVVRGLDLDCPAVRTGLRSEDRHDPTPLLQQYLDPKSIAEATSGDLLVFKFGRTGYHLGIATELFGSLAFVHAYDKRRRVVEVSLDHSWQRRLCGCYEFRRIA